MLAIVRGLMVFSAFSLVAQSAFADATVEGIVYSLPPGVNPITDVAVEINVFPPVADSLSGELLRLPDGRLESGSSAITSITTATDATGRQTANYRLTIPMTPGVRQIVIIRFNRAGSNVTQELNGIVVSDGQTYRYDVVVPVSAPATRTIPYCRYCPRRHCWRR
jgi:hypothetical protein